MYKNTAIIIPALDRNRYSKEGDLVAFGDLTLLEWKLTQVKNFISAGNIFISTPSSKIEKIAKQYGVHSIKRKEDLPMADVITESVKKIDKEIILWSHITSPFVSSVDFKNMLDKFLKLNGKYDSLISVFRFQEFMIFKNKALNFTMTKVTERKTIEPVYRITNGCFIARNDVYLRYKNYFGAYPFLYETDILASMEIKDTFDLTIANDLISLFFRKELKI